MELIRKSIWSKDEYYCDVTQKLDELIGAQDKSHYFRNYLLDTRDHWENTFAIRIPGRTIGVIKLNEKNKIVGCVISDKRYPTNTNEVLTQFIGKRLNVENP